MSAIGPIGRSRLVPPTGRIEYWAPNFAIRPSFDIEHGGLLSERAPPPHAITRLLTERVSAANCRHSPFHNRLGSDMPTIS